MNRETGTNERSWLGWGARSDKKLEGDNWYGLGKKRGRRRGWRELGMTRENRLVLGV